MPEIAVVSRESVSRCRLTQEESNVNSCFVIAGPCVCVEIFAGGMTECVEEFALRAAVQQ